MFPGAITDLPGLRLGHHTDPRRPTGCSVLLCTGEQGHGAVCGVDVRGAAPGTRETDLLHPLATLNSVHALLLTGGSAFGLDAATGVMRWLEARGHGVAVAGACVPIVPAAVLFDLWVGDGRIRPDAQAGFAACEAALIAPTDTLALQGSVGAGAGASVGKLLGSARAMKGGIGTASLRVGGRTVAALVAVNALGDVVDPATGRIVAGARDDGGTRPLDLMAALIDGQLPAPLLDGQATTIGVVATDAPLSKAQACKLAAMAHDGLARCIQPVHTPADGDTLFGLSTAAPGSTPVDPSALGVLGALAAEVCTRAVLNAVRAATGLRGAGGPDAPDLPTLPFLPSARDLGWA